MFRNPNNFLNKIQCLFGIKTINLPNGEGFEQELTLIKEKNMKLLVLDGNSILNRAFYGIRLLTTKEGLFTNGIYGFLTMLQKLKNETNPDAVAIAFDMRAPTFRHKEYAGYKAQRKGMPEELAQQLPT